MAIRLSLNFQGPFDFVPPPYDGFTFVIYIVIVLKYFLRSSMPDRKVDVKIGRPFEKAVYVENFYSLTKPVLVIMYDS
jgi:hypothetical protein